MFVSDWMTTKVFTISPESSISDAAKLTKEKKIKHVPVVKGKKIKGLLSDRDMKEYVPSRATSLDVYELHSLLAKTKVKSVMKTSIVTTSPDTPIEEAALIMHDANIGCLPVVDGNKLIGIISDRDIFRVLVDITGIRHRGHRICITVKDKPGSIKDVTNIIRKHGFNLQSILTLTEGVKKGFRKVVIRAKGSGTFNALKAELGATYVGVKIKKG
jgi:acetoin utilization protein AcuB